MLAASGGISWSGFHRSAVVSPIVETHTNIVQVSTSHLQLRTLRTPAWPLSARISLSCNRSKPLINTRLQPGEVRAGVGKRFQLFSVAEGHKAVETALLASFAPTGLKPGVNESLQETEIV
jgi:hypothetical protein